MKEPIKLYNLTIRTAYKLDKKMNKLTLDKTQLKQWGKNLLYFTAPILAVFFGQLAMGVNIKPALLVASLALYGLLADYFKKLKN